MIMTKMIVAALVSFGMLGALAAPAAAHSQTAKKPAAVKTGKSHASGATTTTHGPRSGYQYPHYPEWASKSFETRR
jgi:hypothetical protein